MIFWDVFRGLQKETSGTKWVYWVSAFSFYEKIFCTKSRFRGKLILRKLCRTRSSLKSHWFHQVSRQITNKTVGTKHSTETDHATGIFVYPLNTGNLWFSNVLRGFGKKPGAWNDLISLNSVVNLVFPKETIIQVAFIVLHYYIHLKTKNQSVLNILKNVSQIFVSLRQSLLIYFTSNISRI